MYIYIYCKKSKEKNTPLSWSSSVRFGWPRVLRLFQINVYCIRFTRRYVTTIKRVMELFARSPSRIFFRSFSQPLLLHYSCILYAAESALVGLIPTQTQTPSAGGVRECFRWTPWCVLVRCRYGTKTKTAYTNNNKQFDRSCSRTRTLVTQ